MEKFTVLESTICPLERANVDTDQIIPKQFLKRVERTGFGQFLFYDWRSLQNGQPNTDFPLNQPQYNQAKILLTKDNFGCGSSREHAPWALLDYGFRVIIAPSFADIFYNNCFQNSILPIVLEQPIISFLFEQTFKKPNTMYVVNLEEQCIKPLDDQASESFSPIAFTVEPSSRHKLLNGLDDLNTTLGFIKEIEAYELNNRYNATKTADIF